MASDTKKKKKSTNAANRNAAKSNAKKGNQTSKNTNSKNIKNNSAKKQNTNNKVNSQKTKVAPKVEKVKKIEFELSDLETNDVTGVELSKTVVLKPEQVKEINNKLDTEEIESLKIVEPKKGKSKREKELSAKTILGLDLPTGLNEEDKSIRKKNYAKDALVFSIIIPILDLFAMLFINNYSYLMITNSAPLNYIITVLFDFVLIFIVTYLIDYMFGEDAVKSINNKK